MLEWLAAALVGGGLVAVAYESLGFRDGIGRNSSEPSEVSADAGAAAPQTEASAGATGAGSEVPTDEGAIPGMGAAQAMLDEAGAATSNLEPLAALGAGFVVEDDGTYAVFTPISPVAPDFAAGDEQTFPKHGLVTGQAVVVRERADLEAPRLGLLRGGARIRVDGARTFGGGCKQGWHGIFPTGFVCMDAGVEVGDTPPDNGLVAMGPVSLDTPMPLDYWRVNHDATPFFHRLPGFEEQERADAAGADWLSTKGRTPMPTDPAQRPAGVPAVVKEYLNAGNYVTIESEHVKSQRHFLRSNRGIYARKYQLEKKDGSNFEGQLIATPQQLPMYFVVRELPLSKREGESGLVTPTEEMLARRSTHAFVRKVRIGDHDFYEDESGNLLRAYAVGVANVLKRPPGVGAKEHWVHVDLSEQTLVAYIGDRPVLATLVSTGKTPGMTPVGVHRIQSKFVATSMRDQPVEDEAYSIEDVPWTQYFSNNVALHGAFWHGGFGLVRSHGCVNLSPSDARWLFGFLSPQLPFGWHGLWAESATMGQGSPVVVTE